MKKKWLLSTSLVALAFGVQAQVAPPEPPPPPPAPPAPSAKISKKSFKAPKIVTDEEVAPKFTPPVVVKDEDPFFKKNPNVEGFSRTNDDVRISLKNGENEHYNLADEKDKKAFHDKYGELPKEPTPPLPPVRY